MLKPSDFNSSVPKFTNGNYANNPLDPTNIEEPSSVDYVRGVEPLDTLPAQWWNWLCNQFTSRFNKINTYVKNIFDELTQLLSLVGVSPDGTESTITTGQLKNAFEQKYPNFLSKFIHTIAQVWSYTGSSTVGTVTTTQTTRLAVFEKVHTSDSSTSPATVSDTYNTKYVCTLPVSLGGTGACNKQTALANLTSDLTVPASLPLTSYAIINNNGTVQKVMMCDITSCSEYATCATNATCFNGCTYACAKADILSGTACTAVSSCCAKQVSLTQFDGSFTFDLVLSATCATTCQGDLWTSTGCRPHFNPQTGDIWVSNYDTSCLAGTISAMNLSASCAVCATNINTACVNASCYVSTNCVEASCRVRTGIGIIDESLYHRSNNVGLGCSLLSMQSTALGYTGASKMCDIYLGVQTVLSIGMTTKVGNHHPITGLIRTTDNIVTSVYEFSVPDSSHFNLVPIIGNAISIAADDTCTLGQKGYNRLGFILYQLV